jgi:membrane-associated phospholipid phosphatase
MLKDHWGRPRPIDVTEFGGSEHFVPWWDPRGDCPNNCSFISGDVSAAAWTFALAALAPAPLRPLAYALAIIFTSAVAWLRIGMGGHFLSDSIFAAVITFLLVWVVHALIYRWPQTALSDETLERGIERAAMPGYEAARGLLARAWAWASTNELVEKLRARWSDRNKKGAA